MDLENTTGRNVFRADVHTLCVLSRALAFDAFQTALLLLREASAVDGADAWYA